MIRKHFAILLALFGFGLTESSLHAQVIVPGLPGTPKIGGLPLELRNLQQLQVKQMLELQKALQGINPGAGALPGDLQKLQEAQRKQMADLMKQLEQINPALVPPNGIHPAGGGGLRWGGMTLGSVAAKDRENLGLPDMEGLVIVNVAVNSAAEKAGVKANDILVKINDKAVPNDGPGLEKLVKDFNTQKFDIVVLRDGKEETLKGAELPSLVQNNPIGGRRPGGIQFRQGLGGLMFRGIQLQRGIPGKPPVQPNPNAGGIPLQNSSSDININGTRISRRQRGAEFTGEYSKDDLKISVAGSIEKGEAKVSEITVNDGKDTTKFKSIANAPANYRVIIEQLLPSANRNLVPNIPSVRPKLDDA